MTIGARMPTAPAADQDQFSIRSAPYWAKGWLLGHVTFPCPVGRLRDTMGRESRMDRPISEILRTLEQHAPTIRRHGVRSLGLFGSRARGTAGVESDLDFVVEFDAKTFDAYMDLKAFLEQLFGVRVDLVLKDAIKPRLRERILAEAIHAPGL